MSGRVLALDRVSFTAADLARTERFFARLGFLPGGRERLRADELALLGVPDARAERLVMRLGRQTIEFLRFDPPGRPYRADSTATDLWFQHIAIVVADMDEAYRRLAAGPFVPVTEGGPQHLPANTGGVSAFKFRDPDGHPLELLFFPEGTGDPAWQAKSADSPFLGIDHTAISVADAERSRRFYEALGLKPASHSLNRGPQQQRLDDVAADVVDVVALEPELKTPHLELLGYHTGTRRPIPPDIRADDIAATRTILRIAGVRGAATEGAGQGRRTVLRDPDRHELVLRQCSARSTDFGSKRPKSVNLLHSKKLD